MTLRAFLFLLCLLASVVGSAEMPPVVEYQLGNGVLGRLCNDGTVQIGVYSGGSWKPLLRGTWPYHLPARIERPLPFTAAGYGCDSSVLDSAYRETGDDDEGLLDEAFFLAGENDGSLADEMIKPLVGIWDLTIGERGQRLEAYHWASQNLSSLIIVVLSQHGGGVVENLRLSLLMPGAWIPLREICLPLPGEFNARDVPDAPQFLANIADPRLGEPHLWVGAALMDLQSGDHAGKRIRIRRADLVVPPLGAQHALALAVGPTRLQVLDDLRAAIHLREGVVDSEPDRMGRLFAPVERQGLSDDLLPDVLLRREMSERFCLIFDITAQQYRLWDPDLFRLDGLVLGPADKLVWFDDIGRRTSIQWSGDDAGYGVSCRPYEAIGANGAGTLEIHFAGPLPSGDIAFDNPLLEAVHLDGRRGVCHLTLDVHRQTAFPMEEERAGDDSRRPQLSPALLVSSPNPFQTATRISFQIPGTMGEAFVQEDGHRLIMDPQQRMPYADGTARAQVTVYNLEGRELVTLFAGLASVGMYETSWDGRDREGRTQASGTYFCRLQVDNWSVTRRLIFIR